MTRFQTIIVISTYRATLYEITDTFNFRFKNQLGLAALKAVSTFGLSALRMILMSATRIHKQSFLRAKHQLTTLTLFQRFNHTCSYDKKVYRYPLEINLIQR